MAHRQSVCEFSVDTKVAVTVSSTLQRTKENVKAEEELKLKEGSLKKLTRNENNEEG
jgi:hypothetical protein